MVEIYDVTAPAELFHQPVLDQPPFPTCIELDLRDNSLSASVIEPTGHATPWDVWFGYRRRYEIPLLTADAANRIMKEIAPLADRITADWTEGPRMYGTDWQVVLGDGAAAAEDELMEYLRQLGEFPDPADLIEVYDVNASVNGDEVAEYGIAQDTTDERIREIADEITQELAANCTASGVAVTPGLEEYLADLRDELYSEGI